MEFEPLIPSLLGPGDPAPAALFNGAGAAPLLIVCDHAAPAVPRALGSLGLDEAVLRRHIGWDIGAARVVRHLASLLDAPAVLSAYSRLVVDCNRAPDDPTSIVTESDGVAVPGNAGLSPAGRAARLAACFHPYHDRIAACLSAFRRKGVAPAVFSVHSFTPVMNGFARPWHAGVLWDRDPRLPVPLLAALRRRNPGLVVGDNEPYSAQAPAGYTMRRHAEAAGLPHALVELRQDLIETEAGAARWAEILAGALAAAPVARGD